MFENVPIFYIYSLTYVQYSTQRHAFLRRYIARYLRRRQSLGVDPSWFVLVDDNSLNIFSLIMLSLTTAKYTSAFVKRIAISMYQNYLVKMPAWLTENIRLIQNKTLTLSVDWFVSSKYIVVVAVHVVVIVVSLTEFRNFLSVMNTWPWRRMHAQFDTSTEQLCRILPNHLQRNFMALKKHWWLTRFRKCECAYSYCDFPKYDMIRRV